MGFDLNCQGSRLLIILNMNPIQSLRRLLQIVYGLLGVLLIYRLRQFKPRLPGQVERRIIVARPPAD